MRLYKYREVKGDLKTDHAIDALLNSYAIFSSRKNFNDLFDSKFHLPHPTPKQIDDLLKRPGLNGSASIFKNWVSSEKFTTVGEAGLADFENRLNTVIDSYAIFCLSSVNNDDQLWAHYANSHTGFCIEFEIPFPFPQKVIYKNSLESVPLLSFIESFCMSDSSIGLAVANQIHAALHVKIKKWEPEHEYRFIAAASLASIPVGSKFVKIPYDPSWVKSVIFGCRASDELKTYIRKNLPYTTTFKQAIEVRDHIEVVDF